MSIDLLPYIIFTGLIFANYILNVSENLDNLDNLDSNLTPRTPKQYSIIKNNDTLFVGDSIEDLFYKLVLTSDGLEFYSKFPTKQIFKYPIQDLYKMTLYGDSLFFFNTKDFIEKKGSGNTSNTGNAGNTENNTFLTVSDGVIKILDKDGNALYTLVCE